ncbi:MAG: hypothetical protein RR355_02270 [Oscillospiraceae bacterium]
MLIENFLNEIEEILENGKTVPFTSNVMIDAERLRKGIEDVRLNMPDEIMQARKIASERKEILTVAQENSDGIIAAAHKRAKELVTDHEITRGAEMSAAEIMQNAKMQANTLMENAKKNADEVTEQAQNWSNDLRTSAGEYVENIVALADETLTNSVNEIRKTRQSLRNAAQRK